MRSVVLCLAVLTIVGVAMAQQGPGGIPAQTPGGNLPPQLMNRGAGPRMAGSQRQNASIPPTAPLVTLEGVCTGSKSADSAGTCKTVITRAQLDRVMDDLGLDPSPATRRQFVINYARLLAATELARQRHLDTSPTVTREIQAKLELTRMEVLTSSLLQTVEQEAEKIPDAEVQQYYDEHRINFEQAQVRRLSVPIGASTSSGQALDPAGIKTQLEGLRERAARAEDFTQLQQELYTALGITAQLPPTKISLMHRETLSPDETTVFDLKDGEVSGVLESPGVFSIVKLLSKNVIPMASARSEIEAVLLGQRLQRQLQEATKGVKAEFNLKYLEQPEQPELFPAALLGPRTLSRGTMSTMRARP